LEIFYQLAAAIPGVAGQLEKSLRCVAIVSVLHLLFRLSPVVRAQRESILLGHTVRTKEDGEETETQTTQRRLEHGKSPREKTELIVFSRDCPLFREPQQAELAG
jgi:hypothetical protein